MRRKKRRELIHTTDRFILAGCRRSTGPNGGSPRRVAFRLSINARPHRSCEVSDETCWIRWLGLVYIDPTGVFSPTAETGSAVKLLSRSAVDEMPRPGCEVMHAVALGLGSSLCPRILRDCSR